MKLPKVFLAILMTLAVWLPTERAMAATVDAVVSPVFLGHTSRGGVNQFGNGFSFTGSYQNYGDVWNSSFVFDLAGLRSGQLQITSAQLVLNVSGFENGRSEAMTFSVGSFTGDLDRLQTLNFRYPNLTTDPRLYAAMMGTTYGSFAMPLAGPGSSFAVDFNTAGLAALNAMAQGSGASQIGMAGSFGYPTYQGGSNQLLVTTGAYLRLTYETVGPTTVPLPAGGVLLLSALAGLVAWRRRQA